jgi:hypothetical protein
MVCGKNGVKLAAMLVIFAALIAASVFVADAAMFGPNNRAFDAAQKEFDRLQREIEAMRMGGIPVRPPVRKPCDCGASQPATPRRDPAPAETAEPPLAEPDKPPPPRDLGRPLPMNRRPWR